MTITKVLVKDLGKAAFYFPESKLAHKYLDGKKGLEIGSGAHNPFGLDSLNVSPDDSHTFEFHDAEIRLCGYYAAVDIVASGDDIPVADQSQDYVISSHVFEHFPNPIRALLEWHRVTKNGGTIFIIAPKRDAHPLDRERPVSTINELIKADREFWTIETTPAEVTKARKAGRMLFDTWATAIGTTHSAM